MAEPNLHPGAREPVRPGDRWLIHRRGDDQPWVGVTRNKRHGDGWSVTVEATRLHTTVARADMVRLLGPAPFPPPGAELRAPDLAKAVRDVGAAIQEVSESILRLEAWLLKEITGK